VPGLEDLSREELIALVLAQVDRIDDLIAAKEALVTTNKELAARVAKLEHLLTRNSGNSSMPPSMDDQPGKTPPKGKDRETPKRSKGKQKGAPGANLSWSDAPDAQRDRFPQGVCECGTDLADGTDLGVVDSFQQIEIPQVAATVTQYDHSLN
jgi:hypothetical protein